jgi:hypothetical protein
MSSLDDVPCVFGWYVPSIQLMAGYPASLKESSRASATHDLLGIGDPSRLAIGFLFVACLCSSNDD